MPFLPRVEEIEPSHLERGQVRIGVRAAGVNFPDYLMVRGKYQVKPPLPFTPGIEAAGEIIECAPDVVDLRPGQRVVALVRRGGAFASELTLPAPFVVPIPDTMDSVTAAGSTCPPGVLEHWRRRNPVDPVTKRRKKKHYYRLTFRHRLRVEPNGFSGTTGTHTNGHKARYYFCEGRESLACLVSA